MICVECYFAGVERRSERLTRLGCSDRERRSKQARLVTTSPALMHGNGGQWLNWEPKMLLALLPRSQAPLSPGIRALRGNVEPKL